jgi:hypothetical protein
MRGRIRATYLIDAAAEVALLGAWIVTTEPDHKGPGAAAELQRLRGD